MGTGGARDDEFLRLLEGIVEDHLAWRRAFGPTTEDQRRAPRDVALSAAVRELKVSLRGSAPFHSPYYVAHMASDVLIPGTLGYIAGLLYNQNNIAKEKGPSTTPLELEVARQLAQLIGYSPSSSWGHLTSGGTTANFEGLWAARNLKGFPFAARALAQRKSFEFRVRLPGGDSEDIRRLSPVELLNLPVEEVLRMRARLEKRVPRRVVVETLSAIGPAGEGLVSLGDQGVTSIGAILLPGTKHYSWIKVAEALGVGRSSLRFVDVDEKMRMKPEALRARVRECRDAGEAVLVCVAVAGSTAEGAVDPVDKIVRVQEEESRRGTPFYVHADAAFGGYARATLLGRGNKLLTPAAAREALAAEAPRGFPSDSVARALSALPLCNSVTIDPHKFGYVPVPAGAILFRDGDVRGLLATPRPYFNRGSEDWQENPPSSIGGFILEGTKPGAAAAACWLAHRVVSLDNRGYGRLVARAVRGAREIKEAVERLDGARIGPPGARRRLRVGFLTEPDLNIMCFAARDPAKRGLLSMNAFNRRIFERFDISRIAGGARRFILSSTHLTRDEYGESPVAFLRSIGVPPQEWKRTKELFLLRAVVLSPMLAGSGLAGEFAQAFLGAAAAAV